MEALTAATTFATFVSLLADFISVRRGEEGDDADAFLAWLSETHHEELKNLLIRNSAGIGGLRVLLKADHAELMERLDGIDRTLTALASHDHALGGIARVLRPGATLSTGALDILRWLDRSAAARAVEVRTSGGIALIPVGGKGGNYSPDDERFFEDDLGTLVELDLLRLDRNSQGSRMYIFTRAAADLVQGAEAQP
jgi:hypothetical protein